MASGYFPVDKNFDWGKKLLEAARLVEEVRNEMEEMVVTQDQTDNAAMDGGSMSLLYLAASLIKQQVKE